MASYNVVNEDGTITVLEMDSEEMLAVDSQMCREKRTHELKKSDWIELSSVSLPNKEEWITYRQALRDVPQQSGFPYTITWPTEPE
jgi:hypothetical protein